MLSKYPYSKFLLVKNKKMLSEIQKNNSCIRTRKIAGERREQEGEVAGRGEGRWEEVGRLGGMLGDRKQTPYALHPSDWGQ